MRRMIWVLSLAVGLACCAVSAEEGAEAAEPSLPKLVTIMVSKGGISVYEVKATHDGEMEVLDLKTAKETTLREDGTKVLDRDVSVDDAVDIVGLPSFIAWRLRHLLDVKTQGKVVTVTPTSIYVNLGERDGIEEGARLVAYREGGELTDPDTGEVLGNIRLRTAELEVLEVQPKFCKVKQLGDLEAQLERGDVVDLADDRRAIAVFPLTDTSGRSEEAAYALAEGWTTALTQWGIPVVERRQLDRVLVEMGLQHSGLFDPDTVVKVGKLVGAFAVVTGSLAPGKLGFATVHARVVKVSSGEVLVAAAEDIPEAEHAVLRRPELVVAPTQQPPSAPAQTPARGVVEGVGWGAARIGATKDEVMAVFGAPEDNKTYWLNYRQSHGIDVFYGTNERAVEIRFNGGFRDCLQSGIGIGSLLRHVTRAYGEPTATQSLPRKQDGMFADRTLYRLPSAAKVIYKEHGVLFWFDEHDRVSQFVVFGASGAPAAPSVATPPAPAPSPTAAGGSSSARVTLQRPYPESYKGAGTDRMSVQYAVIELARQAGFGYNWNESYGNTDPDCRKWVTPNIVNVPFDAAMREVLNPFGLTYEIRNNSVVLRRL